MTPQKPKLTPVLSDKALLLESIRQLDDHDSTEDLPISPDGRYLLLSNTDSDLNSVSPSSPTFVLGDKGGAGDVDGAEAENPDSESEA